MSRLLTLFASQGKSWDPTQAIDGQLPSLWLTADQGVRDVGGNLPDDGEAVASWISAEGNAYEFSQADNSKRPIYRTNGINGLPAIDFDGGNDILVHPAAILGGTQGTVITVHRLDLVSSGLTQTVLASCDQGAAFSTYQALIASNGGISTDRIALFQDRGGADFDGYTGSVNVVAQGTNYIMVWASNGTTNAARLNGVAESLGSTDGDWWGDMTGLDNVTLGGMKHDSEDYFLNGRLQEVLVYPVNLSPASVAKIEQYYAARVAVTLP
jgi:hypothetical protein